MTDGNDYDVDAEVGVPKADKEPWADAAERLRGDGMGGRPLTHAFWRKQHRRRWRDSDRQDCADYVDCKPLTPDHALIPVEPEVTVRV